jgi:hypothetical protein
VLSHFKCQGLADANTSDDFLCFTCVAEIERKSRKRAAKSLLAASASDKGKGVATAEDSAADATSDDDHDESEAGEDLDSHSIRQPIDPEAEFLASERETDSEDDDLEGPRPNKSRFVAQQRRDDELADDDLLLLTNDEEFADFVTDQQPDDETRHRLALLSLPANKVWAESDLDIEFYLRVGLLLLYNRIQGKQGLALSKSIHIRYLTFPHDVTSRLEAGLKVNKTKERAIQKKLEN